MLSGSPRGATSKRLSAWRPVKGTAAGRRIISLLPPKADYGEERRGPPIQKS